MKTAAQISNTVDIWVAEEELPVRACLKVVRRNDPYYGLGEDEIEKRNEFIQWYLFQDFLPLMMIPKQAAEYDFFITDCDPAFSGYSAFNTHDFQKTLPPFDRYGYAMKKIMERIKDIAILHSVISSPEGRMDVSRRYESVVELEFRDRLMALVERFKGCQEAERRFALKQKIGELNRRIIEAKRIWERFAPWDI